MAALSSVLEQLPNPAQYAELSAAWRAHPPPVIVREALALCRRPVLSTNFRPFSIVLLHMVSRQRPEVPVIWVDSGYNTPSTYRYADEVTRLLGLNLRVYTPRMTAARREALLGGVPGLDEPERHAAFTREVKLEPFERALDELRPDGWFTGIRRDQTEYRRTLDVISAGPRGTVRIAPLLDWTEVDLENYLYEHGLPNNDDYYDPTKVREDRECGLQTLR